MGPIPNCSPPLATHGQRHPIGNRALAAAIQRAHVGDYGGSATSNTFVQRMRSIDLEDAVEDGDLPWRKPADVPRDAEHRERVYEESSTSYAESLGKGMELKKQVDSWKEADVDDPVPGAERFAPINEYRTYLQDPTVDGTKIHTRSPFARDNMVLQSEYVNSFKTDGTFTADWNKADLDEGRNEETRGPTQPAPNSEIIWAQYQEAAGHFGLERFGGLHQIHRTSIINYNTVDTIHWSDGSDPGHKDARKTIGPDDEDFWPLLGTKNGRSAVNLLTQHGHEFGAKDIQSVEYSSRDLWINFGF